MSEMQLIADRVVIIGKGRLIADSTVDEVLSGLGGRRVRVRTPDADLLAGALAPLATAVERTGADELEVDGLPTAEVGAAAHRVGAVLHRLAEVEQSLEQAYLGLTEDSVEHHGQAPARVGAAAEGGVR